MRILITSPRTRALLDARLFVAVIFAVAALIVVLPWAQVLETNPDYVHWLASGSWYATRQLAGPYGIESGDVLYPPQIPHLLIPFRVLPPMLWWVVPAALGAWGLRSMRPPAWSWPLLLLCLAWPLASE